MHEITDYNCWVQADEVGDEEERENIPPADTPPSDRKVSLPWYMASLTVQCVCGWSSTLCSFYHKQIIARACHTH